MERIPSQMLSGSPWIYGDIYDNVVIGKCCFHSGADPGILKKGGAFYVGHYVWPTQKIIGYRWSQKPKITLETISFLRSISISIFKSSPFLYIMKGCWWSLTNFSKFTSALIKREKEQSAAVNEKRKTEKSWNIL